MKFTFYKKFLLWLRWQKMRITGSEEKNESVGVHEAGNQVFSCLNHNEPTLLAFDGSPV